MLSLGRAALGAGSALSGLFLLAAAVIGTLGGNTNATAATLHGTCVGCVHTQVGGVDVTVLGPGGVTNFSFDSSPAATGDLQLKFLIPNNFTLAQVNAFAAGVDVVGTSTDTSLTLVSSTPWTSGQLDTYLGHTASPSNPIGAWLPATQTLQPTATGYFVLLADMGEYSLTTPGGTPSDNLFSLDPAIYAQGGLILANLFLADGSISSTANSSTLFFNRPSGGPFSVAPIPIPPAAALFLSGLVGLASLGMRKKLRRRHERTA